MPKKSAPPDSRVAAVAARQHGVVAIVQLRQAGLSDAAVLERTRAGRLHRVYRGVYAVGHRAIGVRGQWMAATLALGPGAVLSHRAAAALWGMLPPVGEPVDVSLPGRGGRRQRRGLRVHRPRLLGEEEVTRHEGIPVTRPNRTVADIRGGVSATELRRAVRQCEVLGLALGDAGGGAYAAIGDGTRSELESMFLQLCRRHGLPRPAVNVRVGALLVDFLWPSRRLVVETDGWRYHRGRAAFEDDRARDLELRSRGYEVLRLSYRQVSEEPARVAEALRAALGEP